MYTQKYGHDYNEEFAPVVKQIVLQCLFTIANVFPVSYSNPQSANTSKSNVSLLY